MSQIEFEHECNRAALLGIDPPTWEEFLHAQQQLQNTQQDGDNVINNVVETDGEVAEVLNEQGERLKQTVGGVDELNSILANTQRKINKFKSVCGSFTNLMKLKHWKADVSNEVDECRGSSSVPSTPNHQIDRGLGDSAMASEVASQVDRLDMLINKTERAQLSMASQNKQMKSFLSK